MKNKQIIKTDKFISDYCFIARVVPIDVIKKNPAIVTLYNVIITKSLKSIQGEKAYHDFINSNYGMRLFGRKTNYNDIFLVGVHFETIESKYLPDNFDCFGNALEKTKEIFFDEPIFDDILIEKNKKEFISYLKKKEKTPATICYKKVFKQIDPEHIHNFDSFGSIEQVNAITKEELIAFHNLLKSFPITYIYQGSNDENQKERLDEVFKDEFELPRYVDIPFKECKYVYGEEKSDAPNTTLEMIYHFNLDYSLNNNALLIFADNIIGGSNSILFNEIREKLGLCYSIYSCAYTSENVLEICTQISSENLEKTIKEIDNIIKNFKDYINEYYFQKAKMDAESNLIDRLDSPSSTFSYYTVGLYKRNRISDYNDILNSYNSVKYEDIIDFVSSFKLVSAYAVKGER